ncbi:MAG: YitT family protein [Ruminococcaceae bacterium]|nr:YitT family protein [Oscillospiraceae bacterium]
MFMNQKTVKSLIADLFYAIVAGLIVGTAYFFFQNSNGFAPGGVGGLATITHYLLKDRVAWSVLMLSFNLPIFVLLTALVNRKLGLILVLYMFVQSFTPDLWTLLGATPYCLANNAEDFNIVFACIATGVISGFGFSVMLKRFGASGGTYGISALLRRAKPDMNIAVVSFIMDASVVFIAFFVYGMKITPVICTLLNLFIANVIVDNGLSGLKSGYKFEIITANPNELAQELMEKMKHGVTRIKVHGMYSDTDKCMLVCIVNKRQIGDMMRILKSHPDTFACFEKVSEVFGNFKRKV